MKKRLTLSVLALLGAGGILVTSLFSAEQVGSSGEKATSVRKLYFNKTILPDHVFYPALMVVDRVQLETATSNDRIFMEIEYAHRRLEYGEALLDEKKEDLAISTISKAEQYLHQAALETNETKAPDSVRQLLKSALEYHNKRLHELVDQLTDADRAVVNRMIENNEILLRSL